MNFTTTMLLAVRQLVILILSIFLFLTCSKRPVFVEFQGNARPKNLLIGNDNVVVSEMGTVEINNFSESFKRLYSNIDNFKTMYINELNDKLIKKNTKTTNYSLRIYKISIDQAYESSGFYTGEIFCVISIEFEFIDLNAKPCWNALIRARSSNADFPSLHPFDARLRNAIRESQARLIAVINGKS